MPFWRLIENTATSAVVATGSVATFMAAHHIAQDDEDSVAAIAWMATAATLQLAESVMAYRLYKRQVNNTDETNGPRKALVVGAALTLCRIGTSFVGGFFAGQDNQLNPFDDHTHLQTKVTAAVAGALVVADTVKKIAAAANKGYAPLPH